ncbi:MAG: glycyl radical protein [Treponema sp.]|jgi:formate C-acetyltransferase|nr:glycyl radical protein [Treponema sp.]
MNYFGELSPRMQKFREELVDAKPYVCVERAQITTETYRKNQDQPLVLRRALMYKNVLERMSIFIEPKTLLAGNHASRNRSAPIFPEYAMDWVIAELDEFDRREQDRFYITPEAKATFQEIAPFWAHNTVKDRGLAAMPAATRIFYDLGIIKAKGNLSSGDAHRAMNYRRMLQEGLRTYQEQAEQRLAALDLTDYQNLVTSYCYRAAILVIEATRAFAKRYAEKALCIARTTQDPQRKKELLQMNRILNRVPYEKAETFYEAVQSLWLVHLCLQIESNGHSLSYGRMDQYLYPFYIQDLAAGRITEESAGELLNNLWLKTFSINTIQSRHHTRFSPGNPLYQNVTIGGQNLDDRSQPQDAVNPLSYLILKSIAQTKLPQPNLTVRYHRGLDDRFMDTCIEAVRLGFGMPAFNNDEIIIPSFINRGVKPEDAYDYSAVGGVAAAVPSKGGYGCTGMSLLNFPKSLLIALNDGVDNLSGIRLCRGLGHFRDMQSFDQVMQALDRIIREFTRQCVIIDAVADRVWEQDTADVLCSVLCEDGIDQGRGLKEGGAVYDFIGGLHVGIANLADSLAAIKKCVFEDHLMTPGELWAALEANFEGPDYEQIRRHVLNAPKYGNDDGYVHSLISQAYDSCLDEMKKYSHTRYGQEPRGRICSAWTSLISAHVSLGAGTSATPDGRKAGEPLAEGCSPVHGMDRKGFTAVFKSLSKLPAEEITGEVLVNQNRSPQMMEPVEDRNKLISLIRAFFNRLMGFHVQFNLVSEETLRTAQAYPEQYRDLIVPVAGYSAFFNLLSREMQDYIIEQAEQAL